MKRAATKIERDSFKQEKSNLWVVSGALAKSLSPLYFTGTRIIVDDTKDTVDLLTKGMAAYSAYPESTLLIMIEAVRSSITQFATNIPVRTGRRTIYNIWMAPDGRKCVVPFHLLEEYR